MDEEDAKALTLLNNASMERCIDSACNSEKETKVRCCYKFCNKLFKGKSFLAKHLANKHPGFGADKLLANAEPFMLARFNMDDIMFRPLPPVEVEAHGSVELRSVREIHEKYFALVNPPPAMPLPLMGQGPMGPMIMVSGMEQQPMLMAMPSFNQGGMLSHGM